MTTLTAPAESATGPLTADVPPAIAYASSPRLENSVWSTGFLMTVLASAAETQGQFALLRAHGPRGAEPPPHVHHREDETFYVLEGEMIFRAEGREIRASAGSCVVLPRDIPHSFALESETATFLVLVTPGGFESFFRELGEPAPRLAIPPAPAGPPDVEKIVAVSAKYGIEYVSA